jgi:hypothetical protein
MLSWFVPTEIFEIAETDDQAENANYADFTGLLGENRWCCQTGLNFMRTHES